MGGKKLYSDPEESLGKGQFHAGRIFAAAVLGGTASRLSGGKFENGAVTGAFSRMFNDEMDHQSKKEIKTVRNSPRELEMLENGDAMGYYESRSKRGDNYAKLAINVLKNKGFAGSMAVLELKGDILLARAIGREVLLPNDMSDALSQVNIDLARSHAAWVDSDIKGNIHGILSKQQITQYHEEYFTSIGLWNETFGGTLLGPIKTPCWLGSWCGGFDGK